MADRWAPVTVLAAALALVCTASAAQEDSPLEPQQTIRVSVGQWDPVAELYTGWPDLGGEFRIGADGEVTLPMAGTIAIDGMTEAELSAEIAARLSARMGLGAGVEAAATIVSYGPVYVVGGVRAAGAYPFVPGLTALQAIALAGGTQDGDTAYLRSEQDALGHRGEYRVLQLERHRLLARLARLQAELAEAETIGMPPELADAPLGDELMAQEREIRAARMAAYRSSLEQFADLETLLRERIARLDEQLDLRARQIALAREELESASALVREGLSRRSRENELERLVADQEVRRLELETARLNAEQRLNELGLERSALVGQRRQSLVEELGESRIEIERIGIRMDTVSTLYAEALRLGDGVVSLGPSGLPTLEVTRQGPDGPELLIAGEETALRAGDVLRVVPPDLDAERQPGRIPVPAQLGAEGPLPETTPDLSGSAAD